MAVSAARRAEVNAAVITLWAHLVPWVEKPAHFRRLAGLMRPPPSHRAGLTPTDTTEVAADGAGDTLEFEDRESDPTNQTGTDDQGQPIYGTRRVKGKSWANFIASVPAGPDRTELLRLAKIARLEIDTIDARIDLNDKTKLGWAARLYVENGGGVVWMRSRGRGLDAAANTHGWKKVTSGA